MRESDFWDAYRRSQRAVGAPAELKNRTKNAVRVAAAERAREGFDARSSAASAAERRAASAGSPSPDASDRRSARPTARRANAPRRRRIAFAVAACACAVAITGGAAVLSNGLAEFTDSGSEQPAILAEALEAFSVKAYATDTNAPLSIGADGSIVLSCLPNLQFGTASPYGEHEGSTYAQEGYYTGCLFRVEGEGIARIQATLSSGVIYRTEIREYSVAENPEEMEALSAWKPEARGTGPFGDYDMVLPTGYDDGVPADSPEARSRVQLVKKLGQTIDIDLAATGEEASDYSFGLWTNEPLDSEPAEDENSLVRIIDQFSGEMLTITVTFDDGSTATQVLELEGVNVRGSSTVSDDNTVTFDLTTEFLDDETIASEGLQFGIDYVHALRATVVASNNDAFPGSLENANDLANYVPEPEAFERRPVEEPDQWVDTNGVIRDVEPGDLEVLDASEPVTITPSWETGTFEVSNVQITYRGRTLPDGIALSDLENSFGNWEYFNRVTGEMDGFTIDEAGVPSEGWSWVVVEAQIANPGDDVVRATLDGRYLGAFDTVHTQGNLDTLMSARTRTLTWEDGFEGSEGTYLDEHGWAVLPSGATATIRWLTILPDAEVLDDQPLYFVMRPADKPASPDNPCLPPFAAYELTVPAAE